MFTIIGGDGKEYGPVTADQIRAWITAGRASLDTSAKTVGSEEWRRLGDYAEFTPNAAPPPMDQPSFARPSTPESAYASGAGSALPSHAGAPRQVLAGVGARTGAACINAFLYFISLMPGSVLFGLKLLKEHPELARGGMLSPENINMAALTSNVLWIYAGLAVAMIVQCIFLTVNGQNVGKLIAGVRVVNASDDKPAGFVRGALVRFVMPVVLMMLLNIFLPLGFLFLIVDYCFMFREDRRCLHDLMAGTKVVKA